MLKIASRFRIKKQVDYSVIDFFLNDPTTSDKRPIKINSKIKKDPLLLHEVKKMSRYFNNKNNHYSSNEIIYEHNLNLSEEQNFLNYWEAAEKTFLFFKNSLEGVNSKP